MNFQNFYTLIFKQKLEAKSFSILFLLLLVLILVSSFVLNILDFSINDNDVIRKYQLAKIYNKKFTTVSTIIIGDSSGGNAINSNYFSKLIGQKSVSLCLTGSWGLSGSLGMLKKALHENNNIKNVIIIQTLDIWGRPYSKESILELFLSSEIRKYISINALISYYFNPREVLWHVEYFFKWLTGKNTERKIDLENDYILQGEKTYANGLSIMNPASTLNKERISTAKEEELKILQDFCHENSLNCIFSNGPIHNLVYKNSAQFFKYLNSDIRSKFTIKYINKIFIYNNEKMGDSSDHIDIKFKNNVTYDYYLEINKYLK